MRPKRSHAKTPKRLPRWMVEIFSSVLVQTGLKPSSCVCPVVGRKPCKMWCELHAFHHFASNVHALFLVISWFIQKNCLPRQSAKLHVGIPESLLWKPFDILEYILIPVIVLNMKWSYVKKNIHISWKWAPTGFDEAPPTIYQRDFHKWYKIHDTLKHQQISKLVVLEIPKRTLLNIRLKPLPLEGPIADWSPLMLLQWPLCSWQGLGLHGWWRCEINSCLGGRNCRGGILPNYHVFLFFFGYRKCNNLHRYL